MIVYVFYVALIVYAVAALRATPAQRTASVVAVAGGESDLARRWMQVRARYKLLRPVFARVGREQNIPASLLAGIAWVESDYVASVVNSASGARGLMQVMPSNLGPYGIASTWTDPYANVTAGAKILRDCGYGRRGIERVLASYGGFVEEDPAPYVRKVLGRASYVALNGDDA